MAPPDTVQALLLRGVTSRAALQRELGVSQPTLSRAIQQLGERVIRVSGGRSARYGLRRVLPQIGSSWPVFVIDAHGAPTPYAELTSLARDQYWLAANDTRNSMLSDGLPYFLADLWPQGFIGRTVPKRFPDLNLPARITDWNDADVLTYLTRRGEDCVGNLLLGDESLQRYLRGDGARPGRLAPVARDKHYPELADAAIAGSPAGSSAVGEHPKFLTSLQLDTEVIHVLVKFSPPVADPVSQRWSDLLVAEHIASKALGDLEVVAAASELVTGGGRMFLESRRFDRSGERGRIGVVSLAAVADHHIGRRDNWMMAAANLRAIGAISAQAAHTMRRAATFGQLIGNTDMHFGNLSFFYSARGALCVTPVYDMLPMIYAPIAGDELPKRNFEPPLPVAGNLDVWAPISQRAAAYWEEVAAHEMISTEFARIARVNAGIAARAGKQVT
jgi:hypothetical protein